MSEYKTDPNDPATPFLVKTLGGLTQHRGLTKREHFAALAMDGLLSWPNTGMKEKIVREAVDHADALIEQLNKKE